MALFKPNKKTVADFGLKRISIEDKEIFNKAIESNQYDSCMWSMNFDSLMFYNQRKAYEILWKEINGLICVFYHHISSDDLRLTILPIGNADKKKLNETIKECFSMISALGQNPVIIEVSQNQLDFIDKKMYHIEHDTNVGMEHVMVVDDIIKLEGKAFAYVRRKLNKFARDYEGAIFRRYDEKDLEGAKKLYKLWRGIKVDKKDRVQDTYYFSYLLKNHVAIGHDLFVVEHNNQIIGIVSGGRIDDENCFCCIRKMIHGHEGLSEFLLHKLAMEYKEYKYLNDGTDGNDIGLRFYKERFNSDQRKSYIVKVK